MARRTWQKPNGQRPTGSVQIMQRRFAGLTYRFANSLHSLIAVRETRLHRALDEMSM